MANKFSIEKQIGEQNFRSKNFPDNFCKSIFAQVDESRLEKHQKTFPKSKNLKKAWKIFPENPLSDHPTIRKISKDLAIRVKIRAKIVLTRFLNHKIRLILTRGLQRDFGLVLDLNSDVKRGLKADKIVEC